MSEDKYNDNEIISIEEKRAIKSQQEQEHLENVRRQRAQTVAKRRQAKKRKRTLVYILVVILLIAAVTYTAVSVIKLEKEKHALEAQQQELELQLKDLKKEVENSDDPEYIEKQVREKLNMIYPDEVLYVTDKEED